MGKKTKNIRATPYVTIKSLNQIAKKGETLMNNIIHEIATKISKEIAENMETTLIEGNNISEFILKTKKMLDEVATDHAPHVAITEKVFLKLLIF